MREILDDAVARFRRGRLAFGHGTTNAWDEAVYLVLHALRLPLDRLTPVLERHLTVAERRRVEHLIERRVKERVPASYLTHEAWLGEHRFYVNRKVIVPRSYIAELLRERLEPWVTRPARVRRVLDLCTGSGCLAILAALAFPQAKVDASDISASALKAASRNVATYRLGCRIRLIKSDLFDALAHARYDVILANPPYVPATTMHRMPAEYRHEPALALAGGADGLAFVRAILAQAAPHLTCKGLLIVETGHYRPRVERSFPRTPFIWPETSGGDDCVFVVERRDLPSPAVAEPLHPKRSTTRGPSASPHG